MLIIVIVIAVVIGLAEEIKDAHDVSKWRNRGGMARNWDNWKDK